MSRDSRVKGSRLESLVEIELEVADCFPVPGHIGKFVFGYVGETKTPAVLMNGRPQ